MKQVTPQSLRSSSSKMNLSSLVTSCKKTIHPLERKEQNSLPFNCKSKVIAKDIILVIGVFRNSFGQFLFLNWDGFKNVRWYNFLPTFAFSMCFLITELLVISQIQKDYEKLTCVRSGISPLSIPTCCGYKRGKM